MGVLSDVLALDSDSIQVNQRCLQWLCRLRPTMPTLEEMANWALYLDMEFKEVCNFVQWAQLSASVPCSVDSDFALAMAYLGQPQCALDTTAVA